MRIERAKVYPPKHFSEEDSKRVFKLIRDYPFATLISGGMITHLPLLFDEEGQRILGHVARANPHWKEKQATAIFHGPHTYVTPLWYEQNDVPTWNYAVVHVRAKLRLITDFKETIGVLKSLSAKFDKEWRFTLPDDLKSEEELLGAIVAFELTELEFEAKFKLGQNRSEGDRKGVMGGLAGRTDEMSRAVLGLMSPV
jgi:transcriptional regulator